MSTALRAWLSGLNVTRKQRKRKPGSWRPAADAPDTKTERAKVCEDQSQSAARPQMVMQERSKGTWHLGHRGTPDT